jgi:hypothetical protein
MFYILWIEDSTQPPTAKFETFSEAMQAAKQLTEELKKPVHLMNQIDTFGCHWNRVQCRRCFDIIESTDVHQLVYCKCKKIAVDGGSAYKRRLGNPEDILEL